MLTGLDLYFGPGVISIDALFRAISRYYPVSKDAVFDSNDPESVNASRHDAWAILYEIKENRNFTFKADIELFKEFGWFDAAKKIAANLGISVAFQDESDALSDKVFRMQPDGSVEKITVDLIDGADFETKLMRIFKFSILFCYAHLPLH